MRLYVIPDFIAQYYTYNYRLLNTGNTYGRQGHTSFMQVSFYPTSLKPYLTIFTSIFFHIGNISFKVRKTLKTNCSGNGL